MRALILAGGKGTRLRPLTVYTPKPIVPIANKPFLLYQLEILKRAGITDITLSLSYQSDKIEMVLGDGTEFGVSLRFVTESSPLGTGGAYKFAASTDGGSTVVLNGDILTDIDISKVVSFHRDQKAAATIVLVRVKNPEAYGLVETSSSGGVVQFLEKPSAEKCLETGLDTINAGIYVLEPSILELIPKNENYSFEYDVFPALVEKKIPFSGYIMSDEYWSDIGTTESYLTAHHDILSGKVKGFEIEPARAESEVATAAFVDDLSLIGDGCSIKPGARLVNSVIGAGVSIEEKAVVENSVIWPHARISTSAEVRNAIIGRGSHIGRNSIVSKGAVLGDKAVIPDYSKI